MIDRDTASRLGLNAAQIDNTLYDAFGQRQVSTIYSARNQYHVIMEVAPEYWQRPDTLRDIFIHHRRLGWGDPGDQRGRRDGGIEQANVFSRDRCGRCSAEPGDQFAC